MEKRQNLGQVLLGFGRIKEEDQTRAVEYQREHGGYFGEALVALGLISPEELEFGLAAQFDLPYVFPDSESIDAEVADLVSPEWALSRLALPISRTDERLTVVVDSPLKTEVIEELEEKTGLEVQLAIASPSKIRSLIRDLHGRDPGDGQDGGSIRPAVGLDQVLDLALAEGARRIGISVRGETALAWWEVLGGVRRRALTAGWRPILERRLLVEDGVAGGGQAEPFTGMEVSGERKARLLWEGTDVGVDLRRMGTPRGSELLMERTGEEDNPDFEVPPPSVVTEVRLLVRSGAGRFAVRTEPPELVNSLLPAMPRLLLGPDLRYGYLGPVPDPPPAGLNLGDPDDPVVLRQFLKDLRAFRFDALAAAPSGDLDDWIADLVRAAGTIFVSPSVPEERSRLASAGVGWELRVIREEGGHLDWSLIPISVPPGF